MGFKVVAVPTLSETVFGDNHATVRPVWTLTRETASPDPMAHGRKLNTWPDGGTAFAFGAPECEAAVNATVDRFPPYTNWGFLFSSFGMPAWAQAYLIGASEDVFQDQSALDLGALYGSDVVLKVNCWGFDLHLQDVPVGTAFVYFSQEDVNGFPAPTAEERSMFVTYKTRAQAAVVPDLVPFQIGDTFISFDFSVNPMTQDSKADVWLRWKGGTDTSTSNWDDQIQILGGAQSKTGIRKTVTINNLLPSQNYTFWLHLERNTSGLTTAESNPKTWQLKPSGQVTFPTEGSSISVSPSPTECKFAWFVPMVISRIGFLPAPASQVEVMLKSDFDTYGWDASRTVYTQLVPAFIPDITRGDYGTPTNPGFILNSGVTVRVQQQAVQGNGAVTQLRAHRDYVYRLRIDFAGGVVYPLSGMFSTPDYSPTRPEQSTKYTEGIL